MIYTIISASYGDPQNTSIVLQTLEAGAVAVSKVDTPELWGKALAFGPSPYVPPAPGPVVTPTEKLARIGLSPTELKAIVAGK